MKWNELAQFRTLKDTDWVIGADEVGYGAWAGPLFVGAVAAPVGWDMEGLADSKALSPKKREKMCDKIQADPEISWVTADLTANGVDVYGVKRALHEVYRRAVTQLNNSTGGHVILDGDVVVPGVQHVSVRKADTFIPVVMAASIIAKVIRDQQMREFAKQFPHWAFEKNKGYGTPAHMNGIANYGLCILHRRSYRPIQKYLEELKETMKNV